LEHGKALKWKDHGWGLQINGVENSPWPSLNFWYEGFYEYSDCPEIWVVVDGESELAPLNWIVG
jgi:hypothetical protein